jgi:hypothetical protein
MIATGNVVIRVRITVRQLQKTIVNCNFCVTNQRVKFDMQRYYARKRSMLGKGLVKGLVIILFGLK